MSFTNCSAGLWGAIRESAIRKFNAANSSAFIFLLSIRAAGRGLNLQSADTVVIYDPDPNPKNEEQARRYMWLRRQMWVENLFLQQDVCVDHLIKGPSNLQRA